jgi:hypothetical protein
MIVAILIMAIMAALVMILDIKGYFTRGFYRAVDWMLAYKARSKMSTAGQRGMVNINTALDAVITIVLVIIVVYQFIPTIEESADTSNITNTTVQSFGDLGGWLIPLLAIIGVITLALRLFLSKRKNG